jgi:hypothetical protein
MGNPNKKRLPSNTLPYSTVADIKAFMSNYVEENGVLLPGRIPGYKNDDIKLLSSCESKMGVWICYNKSCEAAGKNSISYSNLSTSGRISSLTSLWPNP